MEKTGLKEAQVKSMKAGDDNKEWIRDNFWFYVDGDGKFRFNPFSGDAGGHILET